MGKYIVALDQGTTSSRAILFDHQGRVCGMAQKEFHQIYPKPGWVEHDPLEIWSSQLSVMMEAISGIGAHMEDIEAIGITNQRETTVVWDKETGKPVYNAIVWQCRRTADRIDRLVADGLGEVVKKKTGLIPDAYFSGSKLAWILDEVPGVRERAEQGKLLFGTIDTWLMWNLTGGASICHRLYQCLQNHAVGHTPSLLGSGDSGLFPDTCRHASQGIPLQPYLWLYGEAAAGKRGSHCRCGRRPAGGIIRAVLL